MTMSASILRAWSLTALAVLAGCSDDDCVRFVDKSLAKLDAQMKQQGRGGARLPRAKLMGYCRRGDIRKLPVFACVLAAADQPAVDACWDEYLGRVDANTPR